MKLAAFYTEGRLEAGVDEAGRGCYAGPVVAAAVILDPSFSHPLLNDSKKLSAENRTKLRDVIEGSALAYAIGKATVEEIDSINILQATYLAMHRAIEGLKQKPEFLLIDGNRFKVYKGVDHACLVKGDGRFASIAAASILAKTERDAYMQQLADEFPQYDWKNNKGYGTLKHRKAIEQYGLCKYHRKSFSILPNPTLFP
ncbi:MAG: ribonuclease HII [Hydrotalea sp.]|nr:ribonuclease HII [Hydrotalea sp.]